MTVHHVSSDQDDTLALYDDFHDARLSDRIEYGIAGTEVSGSRKPIPGDWTVTIGSPIARSGYVSFPAGDSTVQQMTTNAVDYPACRWEFSVEFQSNPSAGEFNMDIAVDGSSSVWRLRWNVGGSSSGFIDLLHYDGSQTNLISSSQDPDTNEHTLAVEGDHSGNWETFYDGVSQGTGTKDFWPTGIDTLRIENRSDAEVRLKTVRVDYRV